MVRLSIRRWLVRAVRGRAFGAGGAQAEARGPAADEGLERGEAGDPEAAVAFEVGPDGGEGDVVGSVAWLRQ